MKTLSLLFAAAIAVLPVVSIAQAVQGPVTAPTASTPTPGLPVVRAGPVERTTVVSTLKTSMLASVCRAQTNPAAPDICSGYILGAFDAASLAGTICPGANVNTIDVLRMGRTALLTPGAEVLTPSNLLGNVFRKTWPCG